MPAAGEMIESTSGEATGEGPGRSPSPDDTPGIGSETFLSSPPMSAHLTDGSTLYRTIGSGPPLLLIHGYPQTHVCWHCVAPELAERHTIVAPDLPGYGDSNMSGNGDVRFSKRRMASTLIELMRQLGHDSFAVVGHDRGARVAYRMALDHPDIVDSLTVIDIVPTIDEWKLIDGPGSIATFHWPFLAQPDRLPEKLLAGAPEAWLNHLLATWSKYPERISASARSEYIRCFRRPDVIDGTCADYRAGAAIDVEHDREDLATGKRITCPVLVLASDSRGDLTETWREWATQLRCEVVDGGHFLPEENPAAVLHHLAGHLRPQLRSVSTRRGPDPGS